MPDQNGREAYRGLVLRYGSRDAHGETTLLIKVMNFNFGDVDIMDSKFEEFNLLIKVHDDISGFDNVRDTIKRAILVARATEQPIVHNFPRDAPGNQSVPESTQGIQTQGDRR